MTEARLSEKKDLLAKYLLLFTEPPTSAVNALIVRTENGIGELENKTVHGQEPKSRELVLGQI